MDATVPPSTVLGKALAVLDALEAAGPLGLADLAAATGLARATAHRVAVALEAAGLVRREADGRFELGLRLIGLGRVAGERFPVAEAARPALARLRDATGESVQLFVAGAGGRIAVVSLESPHGLRWIVPEGSVLPLDRGSAGRVLVEGPGASGWVESVEEREAGVASVSAPVRDRSGAVVAAVSVSGPVDRLGRRPGDRYGAAVVAAATEVGAALRRAG